MADHSKAMTHHGLAGKALAKGNHKLAAHHLGHAMRSLRGGDTSKLAAAGSPGGASMTADERAEQDRGASAVATEPGAPTSGKLGASKLVAALSAAKRK
jgi:hypothetical protein